MDGASSDLRTGLPVQMTEVHEPLRLLFVMECDHQKIQGIIDRHPNIGRMFINEWVQLAALDPHSSTIHLFVRGKFEPYDPQSAQLPRRPSSSDWYRGLRDHLDFAVIGDRSGGGSVITAARASERVATERDASRPTSSRTAESS